MENKKNQNHAHEQISHETRRSKQTEKKVQPEKKSFFRKGIRILFQIIRTFPVFVLLLLGIAGVLFFGEMYLKTQEAESVEQNKGVMTITCPKLSGAADAFLLYNDGDAILIDTGLKEDGDTLVQLLKNNHISSLKALILTHYDKDHIGGAADILENFAVEKCYMTCGSEDNDEYTAMMDALEKNGAQQIMVAQTVTFSALNGEFTIYPPLQAEYETNSDNNLSLITKISFQGKNLLFAADTQKERTDEYLKNQYDGTQFDFLKVPRHGRSIQTINALLDAFTPAYAVITSSKDEPAEDDVVTAIEDAGVDIYYTKDGTVVFKVNQYGITVKQ